MDTSFNKGGEKVRKYHAMIKFKQAMKFLNVFHQRDVSTRSKNFAATVHDSTS